MILSINEAERSITVVDREDNYSAFKLSYMATKTKEGLVVTIDYEKKAEMALGVTEKTESVFKAMDEVEMIAKDVSAYELSTYSSSKINELSTKLEETTAQYEAAKNKITELETHLAVFEKEKKQFMKQKHKDIVDTLIASRREEMGKFSEYLDYCIKIDYAKSVEQVEKDIKEIHYNFLSKSSKSGGKKSFSAIETNVADNVVLEGNSIAARYGEDIAKYFK